MNYIGILIGIYSLFVIGLFHPIVIKFEYHFSYKVWPVFLIVGSISMIISLIVKSPTVSILIGIFGTTCFWTIKELFEQNERVKKGYYPQNLNRTLKKK